MVFKHPVTRILDFLLHYRLKVVHERDICISPFECVIGVLVPGNIINPVGFVVVPIIIIIIICYVKAHG